MRSDEIAAEFEAGMMEGVMMKRNEEK